MKTFTAIFLSFFLITSASLLGVDTPPNCIKKCSNITRFTPLNVRFAKLAYCAKACSDNPKKATK